MSQISKVELIQLPSQLIWSEINNTDDLNNLYILINNNYAGNDVVSLHYSKEYLKYALSPPGYHSSLHIGIRSEIGKRPLVGFISGIPMTLSNNDISTNSSLGINFLCVHRKLRNVHLTPRLIQKLNIFAAELGYFNAIYTANAQLTLKDDHNLICTTDYYHRPLNVKNLDGTFIKLSGKHCTHNTNKKYKLNVDNIKLRKLRDTTDLAAAYEVYTKFSDNSKFGKRLFTKYSYEEFSYWFAFDNDNFNVSFINDDKTVFAAYYVVQYNVIKTGKTLNVAFLHNLSFVITNSTNNITSDIMNSLLHCAKNNTIDVFNCLNIGNNSLFLDKLKFAKGSGGANYYGYGLACDLVATDINVVLF